jgi:hypothetical protein
MGAWVATVLRDLFHDTDNPSPPRTTGGARFLGGTKSGAPTSCSWHAGDFVIDQTGKVRIYTGSAWVSSHS